MFGRLNFAWFQYNRLRNGTKSESADLSESSRVRPIHVGILRVGRNIEGVIASR